MIHLSCKDFNRNGLESAAWELAERRASTTSWRLSGDYPGGGLQRTGQTVFDIDSIGLLTMLGDMNRDWLGRRSVAKRERRLRRQLLLPAQS
jgi:methylenetetrahydrofolate reductase (NADPH)